MLHLNRSIPKSKELERLGRDTQAQQRLHSMIENSHFQCAQGFLILFAARNLRPGDEANECKGSTHKFLQRLSGFRWWTDIAPAPGNRRHAASPSNPMPCHESYPCSDHGGPRKRCGETRIKLAECKPGTLGPVIKLAYLGRHGQISCEASLQHDCD